MRAELSRRPAAVAFCGLGVGLTAVNYPLNLVPFLLLLFVLDSMGSRLVAGSFFVIGLALSPNLQAKTWTDRPFFKGEASVATVPRIGKGTQSCEVDSGDQRFSLTCPADLPIGMGDTVRVSARVVSLAPSDARRAAYGIAARIVARPGEASIVHKANWPMRLGQDIRRRFIAMSAQSMDADTAAIADGICFEVGGEVGAEVQTELQRSGSVYILSASGLHVFLIAAVLAWAFSWVPVAQGFRLAALAVALFVFASACGFTPSVVRASLASLLGVSAFMWRRDFDALSAMSVAAVGYLLWSPGSVYDLGFQLSMSVVAGVSLFPGHIVSASGLPMQVVRHVVRAAHISLVATLAGGPIIAQALGIVPVVAVVANVLLGLLLAPIALAGLVAIVTSVFSVYAGCCVLAYGVGPLARLAGAELDALGRPDWAAFHVPAFSGYWLLLYYCALLMIWRPRLRGT